MDEAEKLRDADMIVHQLMTDFTEWMAEMDPRNRPKTRSKSVEMAMAYYWKYGIPVPVLNDSPPATFTCAGGCDGN